MILFSSFVFTVSCDFPKDPDDSFEKSKNDRLMTGIIPGSPWITFENGIPSGIEAEIVNDFAARNNLQVQWVTGTEDALLSLLKERKLHIVAGGLIKDTPWKKEIGMTRVYRKEKIIVAYEDTLPEPAKIKDLPVCYNIERPFAEWIGKKGGIALFEGDSMCRGYFAIYESEAEQQGLNPTSIVLHEEKHIIAVAPGENSLLFKLEKSIQDYKE